MEVPWNVHILRFHGGFILMPYGTLVVLPWCNRGGVCASMIRSRGFSIFLLLSWCFHEPPRCLHGVIVPLCCFHGCCGAPMVPPWGFYGTRFDQTCFHGGSVVLRGASVTFPLCFGGGVCASMVLAWCCYGFPWFFQGAFKDVHRFPWCFYGEVRGASLLDGDLDAVMAELILCIHLDPAAATVPPTVWASNAQHHDSRKWGG